MQVSTSKLKPAAREHRQGGLLDWAPASQDNSYSAVEDLVNRSNSSLTNRGKVQKEMEELARWLEEDDASLRADPWKLGVQSGAIFSSPIAMEGDHFSVGSEKGRDGGPEIGFDDDFTAFVSAPPEPTAVEHGFSKENDLFEAGNTSFGTSFGEDLLVPAQHAGALYKSLGSVSDFGGSDDNEGRGERDEDLPTQEEIQATSKRIFGTTGLSPPPPFTRTQTTRAQTLPSEPQLDTAPGTNAVEMVSSDSQNPDMGGDGGYDMAPFDFSRVLSALRGMKAEIASMEDEEERRKAAAKVALGLVYGLEADAGMDLE
jgi:hypothetical protein